MKKLVLFLAAFSVFFASCEKSEEDKNPIDASKVRLLMDGYWQLTGFYLVEDIDGETPGFPIDLYTPMPGCEKDNIFKFTSSSTFMTYEMDSKCSMSAPDEYEWYYQLSQAEKHITMWSNVDDRENSIVFDGEIFYPKLTEFYIKYKVYNPTTEKMDEYSRYYTKKQ